MRCLVDLLQVGTEQRKRAVRANHPIQARLRARLLGEKLTQRRDPGSHLLHDCCGVRDLLQSMSQLGDLALKVVKEQSPCRWQRCGSPWLRWCWCRAWRWIQQRPKFTDASDAV